MRSVRVKNLPRARSRFHPPGPRKAFLAVILEGNGPKSEIPPSAVLPKLLATGSVKRLKTFPPWSTPLPVAKLEIVPAGTYLGMPPRPRFKEFVLSETVNEVPVRAVNIGTTE